MTFNFKRNFYYIVFGLNLGANNYYVTFFVVLTEVDEDLELYTHY